MSFPMSHRPKRGWIGLGPFRIELGVLALIDRQFSLLLLRKALIAITIVLPWILIVCHRPAEIYTGSARYRDVMPILLARYTDRQVAQQQRWADPMLSDDDLGILAQ